MGRMEQMPSLEQMQALEWMRSVGPMESTLRWAVVPKGPAQLSEPPRRGLEAGSTSLK